MGDGLAARAWRTAARVAQTVADSTPNVSLVVRPASRLGHGVSTTVGRLRLACRLTDHLTAGTHVRPGTRLSGSAAARAGEHIRTAAVLQQGTALPVAHHHVGTRLRIHDTLVSTPGAAAVVSNTPDQGAAAWEPASNALGKRNGTLATHAGSLAGARDASLVLGFPAQPAAQRSALVIDSVTMRFYVRQTGTVIDNGRLELYAGIGSNRTLRTTFGGDVDHLTVPQDVDLTSLVAGSWENVAALTCAVRHQAELEPHEAAVDAVELDIRAHADLS